MLWLRWLPGIAPLIGVVRDCPEYGKAQQNRRTAWECGCMVG